MKYEIEPIARIEGGYSSKFGIPRQSGLDDAKKCLVVFEDKYKNDAYIRGIEQFSHLWLIWEFSENIHSDPNPTVRPPRLGGNKRVGVFATRSPFRPNFLGLSCVRLDGIAHIPGKGNCLEVSGADMLDGTPVFDIKPYISYTDSQPEAVCGFADDKFDYTIFVDENDVMFSKLPADVKNSLINVLEGDPRPSYQEDPNRVYGFDFEGYEVKFRVCDGAVRMVSIKKSVLG